MNDIMDATRKSLIGLLAIAGIITLFAIFGGDKVNTFRKAGGVAQEVVLRGESPIAPDEHDHGLSGQMNGIDSVATQKIKVVKLKHLDISKIKIISRPIDDEGGGIIYVAGQAMNLSLPGKNTTSYRWCPGRKLLLARYGEYDPIIYTATGGKVIELTFPEGHSTSWQWLSDKEMVGVTVEEAESNSKPNNGSEKMLVASSVKFFLYRLEGSPHLLEIEVPKTDAGHFVQLEGVTPDGDIILSSTEGKYYDQGGYLEFLGVYKIAEH